LRVSRSILLNFSVESIRQGGDFAFRVFGYIAITIVIDGITGGADFINLISLVTTLAGFELGFKRMRIVTVQALVDWMRIQANVFLVSILIGSSGIGTEQGSASAQIVNVLEIDLGVYGVIVFAFEGIVHTGCRFAALVAADTNVAVIGDEFAIGILTAQALSLTRWEGYRSD
jgi:hypothetical protein